MKVWVFSSGVWSILTDVLCVRARVCVCVCEPTVLLENRLLYGSSQALQVYDRT